MHADGKRKTPGTGRAALLYLAIIAVVLGVRYFLHRCNDGALAFGGNVPVESLVNVININVVVLLGIVFNLSDASNLHTVMRAEEEI